MIYSLDENLGSAIATVVVAAARTIIDLIAKNQNEINALRVQRDMETSATIKASLQRQIDEKTTEMETNKRKLVELRKREGFVKYGSYVAIGVAVLLGITLVLYKKKR